MNFIPIMEMLERGKDPVLRTWLNGEQRGESQLLPQLPDPQPDCYDELLVCEPKLMILGGGHVGAALCRVASFCGFGVTVIDERSELLTEQRFPGAERHCVASYNDLTEVLPTTAAYYVVTTSGHKGDYLCTRQVLEQPFLYAGMIGSRRKVAMTRKQLLEDGIPPETLALLHAPIGLNIHAETPEEIAVSICGELIETKNSHEGTQLPKALIEALAQLDCRGMLCTIIEKKGSVPRSVGSKMLVRPDGSIVGTIGGGRIEYMAIQHALEGLNRFDVQSYGLTPEENTGMACGGSARVMFQPVDHRLR